MAKKIQKPEMKKKGKDDWVVFVNDIIRSHPAVQNKFPIMALCKNFYKGEQYKWINPETGQVIDVVTSRETRCIYNFIRVFIKTMTAKMIAGNPQPQGKPHVHNTERFDRDVAHVANPIIRWWWRRENMSGILRKFAGNGQKYGIGVVRLYYEPYSEEAIEPGVAPEDSQDLDMFGRMIGLPGRIRCRMINSRHYYPDSVAIDDPDRRYVLSIFGMARDLAEEKFDRKFKADDKTELESDVENTTNDADAYEVSNELEGSDIVIVKDLEMMPSKLYPNGKHIIVIDDQVVIDEDAVEGDEPPSEYELSYFTYRTNRDNDEYYGQGYIYPLLTAQRDYNKSQSMVMENMTASGFNKLVIKDGAIPPEDVTDDPMDTLRFKVGDKWSDVVGKLEASPYPHYIVSNPDSILQKAMFMLGLNPLDFSLIPDKGAQSAGTVIRELKESSRVAFSEDIGELKAVIANITMRFLRLVQLHFTEDQIVQIVGDNLRPKVKKFLEAKLSPDKLDIDIAVGMGFDEGTEARVQYVTQLVAHGIFTPLDAKRVMRDYGNVDALLEDTFLDEEQAERNLDRILDGADAMSIRVSQFANHDAHIKVFSDFVKTPEWEELDEGKKLQIDRYIMNMMGHKQASMAMQAPEAGMMGRTGPQGGKPGPSKQPPNMMAQQQGQDNMRMSPGRPQVPGVDIGV